MLEAALLILAATGGLWMLARRWQQRPQLTVGNDGAFDDSIAPILAGGGLYCLGKPGERVTFSAFSDLQLVSVGLTFRDNQDGQTRYLHFTNVQWVSAVTLLENGIAQLTLHLEQNRHWRILTLQIPQTETALLTKVLRNVIPSARLNIGRPAMNPVGPILARIADETLQGETILGAEVGLYLLPHMLLVLQDDTVQGKLDISSIRRVLAVERIASKFDGLLQRGLAEGIIRLYSLHETAVFVLPQYRELAEEISYLSRCPVEFIFQEDKTDKS